MSNFGNWGTRFGSHVPRKTAKVTTTTVIPGGDKKKPLENEQNIASDELVPYTGHVKVGIETGKAAQFSTEKLSVYCEVCIVCDSTDPEDRKRANDEAVEDIMRHIPHAISAADSVFNYQNLYLQSFIKENK